MVENVLINGHGGRESSLAWRLYQDEPKIKIHGLMGHQNPTIAEIVRLSGGQFEIGDPNNRQNVGEFAARNAVDLAIISSDIPLANGVVDELDERGIRSVGPNQAGARIEHDKVFSRQLIDTINPDLNPLYRTISSPAEIRAGLDIFRNNNIEVVVKPSGLTGGKGVKVMGPHFSTFEEAEEIAQSILAEHDAVLLEEKIDTDHSVEFTVQAFTDGKEVTIPPVSIDYPYRFDGDTGPGTGGMGAFTETGKPDYLTAKEMDTVATSIQAIIDEMSRRNLHFSGILNAGFFATPNGLKIVECNARPGDPECMNMMMLLDKPSPRIFEKIAMGELSARDIRFKNAASVVVYLVNKEYAGVKPAKPTPFFVDRDIIERSDAQLFFASAQPGKKSDQYITTGSSRSVAVGAIGDTLLEARDKVYKAIAHGIQGPLDYRYDIGDPRYVENLTNRRLRR